MFTHVCVSANNLEESRKFYAAVLEPLGVKSQGAFGDRSHMFAKEDGGGRLLVMVPRDGNSATASNGGTIGFRAETREAVDAFHAAGLANGGVDEGAPGPRLNDSMHAAYLRDPVGNKICAFYGF